MRSERFQVDLTIPRPIDTAGDENVLRLPIHSCREG